MYSIFALVYSANMASFIGRQDEAALLEQAYDRITTTTTHAPGDGTPTFVECILISGHSGTGKTTLAHSLLPRLQQDGGYFVSGKFELATLQDPFAVFVSAFTRFVESLEENDDDDASKQQKLDGIRAIVQEAVGSEMKHLTNVIPALEKLTGPQEMVGDIRGSDAMHLFQIAFCKLCRALCTVAPLVLFLDDLQWSDQSSLELLQSLLATKPSLSNGNTGMMVIFAYRDEEIYDEAHKTETSKGMRLPFVGYLNKFLKLAGTSPSLNVTEVYLNSFDESTLNQLVAAFLGTVEASTVELAKIMFAKSDGNPYFASQILQLLVAKGYIYKDERSDGGDCCWRWNVCDIDLACASADTIDELVRNKVVSLPPLSIEVFKIAACIGDEIDEGAIATVMGIDIPEFEMHIQAGQAEGLVEYQRHRGRFRFTHDRIRFVILSTIDDKNATMFRVGQLLWTKASVIFLAQKMFLIASLLNFGTSFMTDQEERYRAAGLNLEAGIKAAALAAFPDASRYLTAGMEYLKGGDYWNGQYDLTLNLYSTAADAEVCNQNFDRVMQLTEEVIHNARTIHDKLRAYAARINSLGQRGMLEEAINYGVYVLQQLGQPLPQKATMATIVLEVIKTTIALRRYSDEKLMTLPPMTDPTILAAIHIMSILLPYTFQAASNYDPLLGTRIFRLCLRHGYHNVCAGGFTTFGWLLCGSGNRKEGYKLGAIALTKIKQARARDMLPRVWVSFYVFINHWRHHLRASIQPLDEAVKVGMEIGDVEYATIALSFKCTTAFSCGDPLVQVDEMMSDACQKMRLYQQESMIVSFKMTYQYIHNLTGRAPNRMLLQGDILEPFDPATSTPINWVCYYFLAANLAFYFGDHKLALDLSKKRQTLAFKPSALFFYTILRQMDALIAISNARRDVSYRKYARKVSKQVLKEMRGWAGDCPDNFHYRLKLLEAEHRSLKPHKSVDFRILECYQEAVEGALKGGFAAEAAIFSELRGDYFGRQGEFDSARTVWEESHELYLKWGATEKAAFLLERHELITFRAD